MKDEEILQKFIKLLEEFDPNAPIPTGPCAREIMLKELFD